MVLVPPVCQTTCEAKQTFTVVPVTCCTNTQVVLEVIQQRCFRRPDLRLGPSRVDALVPFLFVSYPSEPDNSEATICVPLALY